MTLFNNAFSIAICLPGRKLLKLLIWSASGTAIEKLVRSMSSDWGQSRPFLISKQMNSQCVPCQYTIGLQSPHSVTPMTSGRLWDLLDWVIHGYTMTTAATRVPSVGMQNNVRNHIWWMQLNSLTDSGGGKGVMKQLKTELASTYCDMAQLFKVWDRLLESQAGVVVRSQRSNQHEHFD